jgi:hypothetical protein
LLNNSTSTEMRQIRSWGREIVVKQNQAEIAALIKIGVKLRCQGLVATKLRVVSLSQQMNTPNSAVCSCLEVLVV